MSTRQKLVRFASAFAIGLTALVTAGEAQAWKFRVLHNFAGPDGAAPEEGLLIDSAGNLYGTTRFGGAQDSGTVFKLAPDGTETVLHSFAGGHDGAYPTNGNLIADASGTLYGTTPSGGAANSGVIFKITPDGTETVLYGFQKEKKGTEPLGRLAFGPNGGLIGTAWSGGQGDCAPLASGCGVVFRLDPNGKMKVLHKFPESTGDGVTPYGGVIIDAQGNMYGTTLSGGVLNTKYCIYELPGCGTVFKLAPDGTETILHNFTGNRGSACPVATLSSDSTGNLFGTTIGCGSHGVAFKLAPNGKFTSYPVDDGSEATLVVDKAGNLYGTSLAFDGGTIFKIAPDGSQTVLHTFDPKSDGYFLQAGLIQDDKGNLYGTASQGGTGQNGTVFELEK